MGGGAVSIIYINSYQFAAAPPSGYDPDAAAYIARVEGASGDNQALETAVKDAINAFVVGCKADGIWNAIKASCILAGARTLNGALQPLVGPTPTNNGFIGIGTDYDRKIGLLGDGASKYLATGFVESFTYSNNLHLSVQASAVGATVVVGGLISSGIAGTSLSDILIDSIPRTTFRVQNTSGTSGNRVNGQIGGFLGVTRSSSTSLTFRQSSTTTTVSQTGFGATNTEFEVFRRPASNFYTNYRLAFYSIGESLDLALLDARVTTLINALGTAIP